MPRLSLRILLVLVLPLAAYSFMLPSSFKTMDDQVSIVVNPLVRTCDVSRLFTEGYFKDNSYYRPLANLTFMGEYHAFGLNPFFYNLDNLLLHIANAFLVWALVSYLTGNAVVGFWSGLLFAIHPIHWEAVANISGRPILLCAFFGFLSFLSFLHADTRRQTGWLAVSLAAFTAALLCKESAVVIPGVFFLYLVCMRAKAKDLAVVVPYAVLIGAYILLRQNIGMTEIYQWRDPAEYMLGFVTFLRSLITHLRLFIFPTDLHFDRCLPLFTGLAQPQAMATVFAWTAGLCWLWIGRKHIPPLVWLCLGWFSLELLPVSQTFITIGVGVGYISTAEHFLYTASVPIFILLVMGGMKVYGLVNEKHLVSPDILKALPALVIAALWCATTEQSIYAGNELSMLERSLRIQPYNARVNFSAGMVYVLVHKFKEGEGYFRAAAAYDPFDARFRIALGKSLCDQGKVRECLDVYDRIKDAGKFQDMLNDNRRAAMALLSRKTHAPVPQK